MGTLYKVNIPILHLGLDEKLCHGLLLKFFSILHQRIYHPKCTKVVCTCTWKSFAFHEKRVLKKTMSQNDKKTPPTSVV